jgi:hypothetical protein
MPDLISLMFSAVPMPQRKFGPRLAHQRNEMPVTAAFLSRGKCLSISPKLARTNVDMNRSSLYGMVRYPRRGLDVRILINR